MAHCICLHDEPDTRGHDRDCPGRDPQNDTPPCSVNRAGHSSGWLDFGETCTWCGLPGSCPHTADVTHNGRWCSICNPALGGDCFDQRT